MKRSQRMQPVKRLADDRADQAAKQFAAKRRQLDEQLQRLTQLESFRREYQGRQRLAGEGGIDAFRLRDYNAFIGRIDAAIGQQRETVAASEREVAFARNAWLGVLGRARALGKVVERAQREEILDAERRAQRQSDEFSRGRRCSSIQED